MLQAELSVPPLKIAPACGNPLDVKGENPAENAGFMALLSLELAVFAPVAGESGGVADAAVPDGKDLPGPVPPIAGAESEEGERPVDASAQTPPPALAMLAAPPFIGPIAVMALPAPENEPEAVVEMVARERQPLFAPGANQPGVAPPAQSDAVPDSAATTAPRFIDGPRARSASLTPSSAIPPESHLALDVSQTTMPPRVADSAAPMPGAGGDPAMQRPAPPSLAAPSSPPPPRDIATLIDRLVEARDAAVRQAGGATVEATLAHAQFGRVAMRFRPDDGGLSVVLTSSDPAFAPAAQAAVAASPPADTAQDNRGSQSRPDPQQAGAQHSGAHSYGPSSHGQHSPGSHSSGGSQAQQPDPRRAAANAPAGAGRSSDDPHPRRERGIYA